MREAELVMPPLVDYAGERGVKLMIENCVMEGWHPDGAPGNLAYSPELWEWMFALGLYLNFDPSHLLWLGIDPIEALRPYVGRVVHAHAKDAEVFPAERNRYGFFGRLCEREQDPWEMGWWRYRLPGSGEVDFRRYVDTLYEGGFQGVLSVEHEDPIWGGADGQGPARSRDRPAQPQPAGGRMNARRDGAEQRRPCSRSAPWSRPTRGWRRCAGSTSTFARERCTACSAPTAPASRR